MNSAAADNEKTGKSSRLRAYLVDQIVNHLSPHDRIPPERDLSQSFGVSRMTVSRVIERLQYEGLVYRNQGSGTFVSERRIAKSVELNSFSEDMRMRGMTPGSASVFVSTANAGIDVGARLGIGPREPVTVIERVRTADGEPMCLETAYIARSVVPQITEQDCMGSLYDLLSQRHGIRIETAEQTISVTCLEKKTADALGVGEFSPAFRVDRLALTASGRKIEYAVSLYRGDRYSYELVLSRAAKDAAS